MLIVLNDGADLKRVQKKLTVMGLWTQPLAGVKGQHALTVGAHSPSVSIDAIRAVDGVADVLMPPSAHPKVDACAGTSVTVAGVSFGVDSAPVLIAGPCSVESEETAHRAAEIAAARGARLMRGGAFKPRTSPYSYTGHGREALRWMRDAADAHGLGVVTEVMSEAEAEAVGELADVLQIGSRNMQNFALLKRVGRLGMPVLLKRGMSARTEEWLLAGEHLLDAGASGVIYCERGVHGFDAATRYMLDLGAVALLSHVHRLPVIVDPSHGTGRRDLIRPMSRAARASGACGLIVEVHPDVEQARSDGPQALTPEELTHVAADLGVLPTSRTSEAHWPQEAHR
ncbi:MAG: 3-deoxy-7-phosphoheptulonate synthase [Bradymonadia bacterium]